MDKLDQYRVFIQVADMGSFIKAAHALELPRASVSAAVQQLEASVGVRLLHRTTRHVQLTADGAQLLERVRLLLSDVEEIDQLFQVRQRQVSGQLKVDMPSRMARRLVVPALPGLLRSHPALRLALGSTDRAIDLVQEGVDCTIRVGELHNSNLVAQPLGRIAMINCASRDYLREHGVPEHPDELADGHMCVGYASPVTGRELLWDYLIAGRQAQISVSSRMIVNNAENYISCCCAGLGLIQIPRFDVQHLLNADTLVEVMSEFRAAPMAVSALYPHRRQRSRRLVTFIEWFNALMQPHFEP